MQGLRIAVSGTRGQVARSLIERGGAIGANVVAIGRPVFDLEDPRTIEPAITAIKPDVFVNAAAMTDTERAEVEPALAHAVNTAGVSALANCTRRLGIPLIHLSTDYVFDGAKPGPYFESDPITPQSVYARSKAAGEDAVADGNPRHVILRPAWIFSPFVGNFVTLMLKLAADGKEIRVVADQFGNPTPAAGIADGILTIARDLVLGPPKREHYGIFHLAGSGFASRAELAETVFSLSAEQHGPSAQVIRVRTDEFPSRVRRPTHSKLDCSKIEAVYGVALPPWRSTLRECIARILEQAQ